MVSFLKSCVSLALPNSTVYLSTNWLCQFCGAVCGRLLVILSLSCETRYRSHVASVIWLWPSSVRNTSSIKSSPHFGQMMSFSKMGCIPSSDREISPTSQSNSRRHFLHSKLIVILLWCSSFQCCFPFSLFWAPDLGLLTSYGAINSRFSPYFWITFLRSSSLFSGGTL